MGLDALLWLLAVAAGVSVANLYYSQPLLAMLGEAFHVDPHQAGLIPTLTQAGYAAGMLFVIPLGDSVERRKLITLLSLAATLAVLGVAVAPSFPLLLAGSFALGVCTAVPQLVVPYAAGLVPSAERGRSVGKVMSGLLVGILLSRTASGFLGARLGWRAVYLAAAAVLAALTVLLRLTLPRQEPLAPVRYLDLVRSLPGLLRREPLLRRHALLGALAFAAFSAFWTTLVFLLSGPPHHLGARAAGLFGVVGVAGAVIAPVAGRVADRVGSRVVNGLALLCVLLSWMVFAAFPGSLFALGAGVVLLDLGAQANHISNQTRVLGLSASMRNRLNTVYMVSYFVGGAAGSLIGAGAFGVAGWTGTGAAGIAISAAALAAFFLVERRAAAEADARVRAPAGPVLIARPVPEDP